MDILSLEELKSFLGGSDTLWISLYMPTERGGTDAFQNPTRLRNLLREAEQQLMQAGYCETKIQTLLKPLVEQEKTADFWEHPGDGLAIFLTFGQMRVYSLPVSFAESVTVAARPNIRPLLPLLSGDGHFAILALSHNAARLLEATRSSVREIPLEKVPTSLAEALRFDDRERQLQSHTAGAGRNAIFHGQMTDRQDDKEDMIRFFHAIDKGLPDLLDTEMPLVLAGAEYLFPLYREASAYPHLMEQGVPGSPDYLPAETLQARAWEIAAPYFAAPKAQALAQYAERIGTGAASADSGEIVSAALCGRVAALFVAEGQEQWGRPDAQPGQVTLHESAEAGDEDLVNLAAIETLLHGGAVYTEVKEALPGAQTLAALLRY